MTPFYYSTTLTFNFRFLIVCPLVCFIGRGGLFDDGFGRLRGFSQFTAHLVDVAVVRLKMKTVNVKIKAYMEKHVKNTHSAKCKKCGGTISDRTKLVVLVLFCVEKNLCLVLEEQKHNSFKYP